MCKKHPSDPINKDPKIISLIDLPLETLTIKVPTAGARAKYHAQ